MNLINKMKKNRKGFTLVEIIVVLVILAVLAAFTIPTMLGFVNEARGKAYIAEAREVYVAAQATATEYGAQGTAPSEGSLGSDEVKVATAAAASADGASTDDKASWTMKNYLGTDITGTWDVTMAESKVESVVYTSNDTNYTVTLTAGADTTVVKN